jgi:hypothetical protein
MITCTMYPPKRVVLSRSGSTGCITGNALFPLLEGCTLYHTNQRATNSEASRAESSLSLVFGWKVMLKHSMVTAFTRRQCPMQPSSIANDNANQILMAHYTILLLRWLRWLLKLWYCISTNTQNAERPSFIYQRRVSAGVSSSPAVQHRTAWQCNVSQQPYPILIQSTSQPALKSKSSRVHSRFPGSSHSIRTIRKRAPTSIVTSRWSVMVMVT